MTDCVAACCDVPSAPEPNASQASALCPASGDRALGAELVDGRSPAAGDRTDTVWADTVWAEARAFLEQCETGGRRLDEVRQLIRLHGTYAHTPEELEQGAKLAWRNHNRCIGKLFWRTLVVLDRRDAETADAVFAALVEHLDVAFNGGRIRPVVTVLPPGRPDRPLVRILNRQLVRYAGHRQKGGGVVGDPDSVDVTRLAYELGWPVAAKGSFDVLPVIIEAGGAAPKLFELPPDVVHQVPLVHPQYEWFAALGLRWYAFPTVSDMRLAIGGVSYPAAPFSGWYVSTEVAARNLADRHRYNLLPEIATRMGLDVTHDRGLWKDRALVELNAAVLHSYDLQHIRMADHHAMTDSFDRFHHREERAGRHITGSWKWLVPPMSPATTPVFHRQYDESNHLPNFFRG